MAQKGAGSVGSGRSGTSAAHRSCTLLSHSDRGQRRTAQGHEPDVRRMPRIGSRRVHDNFRRQRSSETKTPHRSVPMRGSIYERSGKRLSLFAYRCDSGSDLLEAPVDIAIVDGVVAFGDAGFLYGKPAHHQILDMGFGLFSGAEAQRVAVPLAGVVGLNFGLEAHL